MGGLHPSKAVNQVLRRSGTVLQLSAPLPSLSSDSEPHITGLSLHTKHWRGCNRWTALFD